MLDGIKIIDRGYWQTNTYFSDYVKTSEIMDNQDNIEQQNNKHNHFLRYVTTHTFLTIDRYSPIHFPKTSTNYFTYGKHYLRKTNIWWEHATIWMWF